MAQDDGIILGFYVGYVGTLYLLISTFDYF